MRNAHVPVPTTQALLAVQVEVPSRLRAEGLRHASQEPAAPICSELPEDGSENDAQQPTSVAEFLNIYFYFLIYEKQRWFCTN